MANKIVVLHQYGAKSHYYGLSALIGPSLVFSEFDIGKQLIKSIFGKSSLSRTMFNLRVLLSLSSYDRVILGMAPGDLNYFWLSLLTKKTKVTWHTSWCDMNFSSKWPRGVDARAYRKMWFNSLKKRVSSVAYVNDAMHDFMRQNFKFSTCVYHAVSGHYIPDMTRKDQILYVGRKDESKGWHRFLKLASRDSSNRRYLVAGFHDKVGLENTDILGELSRDELSHLYSSSKFLLNLASRTSKWEEVFGLSMAEAIVCGCKVIAYRSAGSLLLKRTYPNSVFIVNNNEDILVMINELSEVCRFTPEENRFNESVISRSWEVVIF
jgi:glycosyltransferase involved in cell wall biosynthesis